MKTRSLRKEIRSNSYMQKPEWSLSTAAKVGDTFRARLLEYHLFGDIRRKEEEMLFWRSFSQSKPKYEATLLHFSYPASIKSVFFFIVTILLGRRNKMMSPHT